MELHSSSVVLRDDLGISETTVCGRLRDYGVTTLATHRSGWSPLSEWLSVRPVALSGKMAIIARRPRTHPEMTAHPTSVRCGEGLPSVGGRT
jgi:hypothetical protein